MNKLKTRLSAGAASAIAVMCLTASVPPLSLGWIEETQGFHDRVERQMRMLRSVESLLVDAETGQRGFVITGREEYLEPYNRALTNLPHTMTLLEQSYATQDDDERRLVADILDNARHKLAELADTVDKRRAGGFAAVEPLISSGAGKRFMDHIRVNTAELGAREARELEDLDQQLNRKVFHAILFSIGSTVLTLSLMALVGRTVWRFARERAQAMQGLQHAGERLEEGMQALQRRNVQVSALSEMSRLLQTEMGLVEALEITGLFCQRLLPGTSGAIHLFRNSADLLERAAGWGDHENEPVSLPPSSCWGLRRGQPHRCAGAHDLKCRHYAGNAGDGFHLCLPLMAYGEVLGQMHVWAATAQAEPAVDELASMAQTISEQVALSLSNAKLRQVLRDQSIKDPLTGLFNRRYMEETLHRELARARRDGGSVAVIAVDLDHFKHVNDAHGHPFGDAVLKGTAQHLRRGLRESDVACRYGGEEFVLILPDCDKQAAVAKAQELCARQRQLRYREADRGFQATASFGVAAFPEDGQDAEGVVEAADAALYRAKKQGRDRVAEAGAVEELAA